MLNLARRGVETNTLNVIYCCKQLLLHDHRIGLVEPTARLLDRNLILFVKHVRPHQAPHNGLARMRDGESLVVSKLDRLGRDAIDVIATVRALPAPGVWYRYVVHYRPGYASSHSPLLEVWRAKPGGAFEKIVSHTGFNTYNTSATGAGASYPRIGLYKWSSSVWTTNSLAWYLTPLYFGTGADLLEAGKASLAGL